MEQILALLGIPGVALTGKVLAVTLILFALGMFRGSGPYKTVRNALGKFSENLGVAVSRIGNSKLKGLYEPLEALFIDYWLFMWEQFAVGLRKDNPEKMVEQVERLKGVGSETRIEGIKRKLQEALGEARVGDRVAGLASEAADASAREKLGQ